MVAMLPESDFSDPVASRQGMDEMLAVFNADVDTSALNLEEKMIPGLDSAPDINVRI